jgi:hypothetical protein
VLGSLCERSRLLYYTVLRKISNIMPITRESIADVTTSPAKTVLFADDEIFSNAFDTIAHFLFPRILHACEVVICNGHNAIVTACS